MGVFQCNIAHRRSVAVLCMLYKIKSTPMHPLHHALTLPYVPMWFKRGALVDIGIPMNLLAIEHRCNAIIFSPLSIFLER